jgi:hypothetical protein
MEKCAEEPGLLPVGDRTGHRSACWLPAKRAAA